MVARGNGTDGWHGNLLTLRDSKLCFWEVAGLSRPAHSGQAQMTTSPSPRPECQDGSRRSGKGHGGSGSHGAFALLLITSAPPASPPSSPSPEATGTIPQENPSRPWDSDRAPREGKPQDAGSGAAVCEISWLLDMLSPRSVYTSP